MLNPFDLVWTLWAISWIVAAFWTRADVARSPLRKTWLPYGLIGLSLGVPAVWHVTQAPDVRFWTIGPVAYDLLAMATLPGFAFAWWARVHLGALWSVAITRKSAHRIVASGPYAYVRHPIYTGLLWAALCTDLAAASFAASISFAFLYAGFFLKARDEEAFLCDQVDAREYGEYRTRVAMLVPRLFTGAP